MKWFIMSFFYKDLFFTCLIKFNYSLVLDDSIIISKFAQLFVLRVGLDKYHDKNYEEFLINF